MNVTPLFRCPCGNAGEPIELRVEGHPVVGSIFACAECVEKNMADLARVRPVFDAMLAAGIDRATANDTMTYLLHLHRMT